MQGRYDPAVVAHPQRAPKVLVVDDEPSNVRLVKAYLTAERFDVLTASSGQQALDLVAAGGVDLVILDIRMPLMDGLEVCRRIRADPKNERLPVVFLTAELKDTQSELDGLEAGGDEYLHKPIHRAALIARVRSLLRLANAERDRQLQAQVAQNEKLAAIGQIAAGVAHEINNPLSFMLSNLVTLGDYLQEMETVLEAYRRSPQEGRAMEQRLDFGETLEDVRSLLHETSEGGHRVRSIVQGLKSFARTEDGPAELVDLAQIASSTLLLTERELVSRATLVKDLRSALVERAVKTRLEQVVLNLLVNAMQAIKGREGKENLIAIRTWHDDGVSWLEVEDTGCGILPEHRVRLFEPFFTTKPVGEGTGMGLSFCANVVRRMGGEIEVDSEPGRGSRFRIRVPSSG